MLMNPTVAGSCNYQACNQPPNAAAFSISRTGGTSEAVLQPSPVSRVENRNTAILVQHWLMKRFGAKCLITGGTCVLS